MKKSVVYSCMALVLLTLCFTVPVLGFHGTLEKIKNNETDRIAAFVYPLWNAYQTGRYKSATVPEEAAGDLRKMIETNSEIGVASFPVWYVALEAPNYPKEVFPDGIPVYFHFDGYSGDVHEMNTINHYIGMFPMERGGQLERKIVPYLLLAMTLMMIWFNFIGSRWGFLLMAPAIVMPVGFIADYSAWLYWYGHNMQEFGAFTIKPFMPTAFGDGKVAQFITHSYPTTGFYVLIAVSVLSLLAVLSKNKELQDRA